MPDIELQTPNQPHRHIRQPKPVVIKTNMAAEWTQWKSAYDWYAMATQLNTESSSVQVAVFMSTIGHGACEIFELTEEQKSNITEIIKKFGQYFIPKKNDAYEAYVFNKMAQEC